MIITLTGADFSTNNINDSVKRYKVTFTCKDSDGGTLSPTSNTRYFSEGSNVTFSSGNVPSIKGYKFQSASPASITNISADTTVTVTYVVSSTSGGSDETVTPTPTPTETWYLDHRQNSAKFTTNVNINGRGWGCSVGTPAYNAIVNKPINTIAFFTNKSSQSVTVTKISSVNASSGTEIATVTATKDSNGLATITFPTVTLEDGEILSLFSNSNDDIHFYYAQTGVADANGTMDNNFYTRVPRVYGNGTAWSTAASSLGWSYGYKA